MLKFEKLNSISTTLNIEGSDLQETLEILTRRFRHTLFGVCSGQIESTDILVFSNKGRIDEARFYDIADMLIDLNHGVGHKVLS